MKISCTSEHGQQTTAHVNETINSVMTNGSSSTVAVPQHRSTDTLVPTHNLLLKQMLSDGVSSNRYSAIKKIDSRQTHVKHSPDGTVQITYKKMVQNHPTYSHPYPVFILPKTSCELPQAIHNISTTSNHVVPTNGMHHHHSLNMDRRSLSATRPPNTHVLQNKYSPASNTLPNQRNTLPNFSPAILANQHSVSINSKVSHVNGFRTTNSLTISLPKVSSNRSSFGVNAPFVNFSQFNGKPIECTTGTDTRPNLLIQTPSSQSSLVNSPQTFHPCAAPMTDLQNGDPMMSSNNPLMSPNHPMMSSNHSLVSSNHPLVSSNHLMELDSDILSSLDMTSFEKELALLKDRVTDLPVVSEFDRKLFDSNNVLLPEENQNNDLNIPSPEQIDLKVSPPAPVTHLPCSEANDSLTAVNNCINIIDVSPEIVSLKGGSKVILVGSWNAKNARYACRFGEIIVDAELIQNGVLKCYSPTVSNECSVKLCVLLNNIVVSNSVNFKFVNPVNQVSMCTESPSVRHEWVHITSDSLKKTLKDRFLSISEILAPCNSVAVNIDPNTENFEDQLVDLCKKLITIELDITFDYSVKDTMTLLHMSAALGYLKLIQFLINWVESRTNTIIEAEASPLKADEFSMLPIMWSAARGHFNTSCVLLQWHEYAIQKRDCCGCTAIDLARECGHESLVDYLKRIERKTLFSRENSDANSPKSQRTPLPQMTNDNKSVEASSSSLRTLGRTLAHIQSILNEEGDGGASSDLDCSDDEDSGSLFDSSYSPGSSVSMNRPLSISTPEQSPIPHQSPFNRQVRETAEFCEFFYQAKKIEKDFAELTLTGEEQEELYRAANVIQTAYKTYKERRQRRDQELSAAVLIQSYYRRYKQYAAFKKMQKGALVIQSQYRAHREKAKRKCQAASVIQSYYRKYKQRKSDARFQTQLERHKNSRYLAQLSKRFSQEIPDMFLKDFTSFSTSVSSNNVNNRFHPPTSLCQTALQTTHITEN